MAEMTEDDLLVLRLRIADTADPPLLTTDQLRALWDAAPGPWSAAADALEVIAVSEVLVSKKIRTQDLSTDGPAVSAELRALAKNYRARAAAEAEIEGDSPDIFDIVDTVCGSWRPEHTGPGTRAVWGL